MNVNRMTAVAKLLLRNTADVVRASGRTATSSEDVVDLRTTGPRWKSNFVAQNRSYWEEFFSTSEYYPDGYLLIDATPYEFKSLINHLTLGMFVAKAAQLRPLYLVNDEWRTDICESFHEGEFVPVTRDAFSAETIGRAGIDFLRYFSSVAETEELIDLAIGGIPIGDLVYSTAMRNSGEGTFDGMNSILAEKLLGALMRHHYSNTIFEQYDIEAALVGHPWFMKGGIWARKAIRYGSNCYMPSTNDFCKFRSMDEIMGNPRRPTEELYQTVWNTRRGEAIRRADEIVTDRLGVAPTKISRPPEKVADDTDPPTALIMPHIFVEHLRFDDRLYKDFLTWFRETLRLATKVPDVDWAVKPHPNRDAYEMKQDAISEVHRVNEETNSSIRIVLDDHSTTKLLQTTNVILTMDGTAGMEYSCYGIPTILASKSPYSGFGFTIEPESKAEYRKVLSSIPEIEPLSTTEIERAKVMSFIYFDLVRDPFPEHEQPSEKNYWEAALDFLELVHSNRDAHLTDVEQLVEEDRRHIYDLEDPFLTDAQRS